MSCVMEIFCHGPGDTESVKGTGAAPDLIEDNQASPAGMFQDIRHFIHFDHKGALTAAQTVRGANTREDPVHHANPGSDAGTKLPI